MLIADSSPDVWIIHCDGTALPNPGRIGIGAVLVAPDGAHYTLSQATGTYGCNNEAEARALIAALHEAHTHGATAVHVHSDSSILIQQLACAATAPIARLAHVFEEARFMLEHFEHVELRWIPGHRNSAADALARAALGLPAKSKIRLPRRRRH